MNHPENLSTLTAKQKAALYRSCARRFAFAAKAERKAASALRRSTSARIRAEDAVNTMQTVLYNAERERW